MWCFCWRAFVTGNPMGLPALFAVWVASSGVKNDAIFCIQSGAGWILPLVC